MIASVDNTNLMAKVNSTLRLELIKKLKSKV